MGSNDAVSDMLSTKIDMKEMMNLSSILNSSLSGKEANLKLGTSYLPPASLRRSVADSPMNRLSMLLSPHSLMNKLQTPSGGKDAGNMSALGSNRAVFLGSGLQKRTKSRLNDDQTAPNHSRLHKLTKLK